MKSKIQRRDADAGNQKAEVSFTPGPWLLESAAPNVPVFFVFAKGNIHIGKVDGADNACLIAAAPELLAACEAALRGDAFNESWRDLCKSAIAKARGASQKTSIPIRGENPLATALRALLDAPDLNLQNLEPETVKAIEQAEAVLKGTEDIKPSH